MSHHIKINGNVLNWDQLNLGRGPAFTSFGGSLNKMSFCICYLVSIDDISLPSNSKIARYLIILASVQKIIDQLAKEAPRLK